MRLLGFGRRRTLLVNRKLQLRFIGLLMLQMSIILTALGLLVHSHVSEVGRIAVQSPVVDLASRLVLERELIDNIHGFYVRSLVLIGVTTFLLLSLGLLASNRLAGPALKIGRYLESLAGGNYSQRIAFRQSDHLNEFAQSMNRMAEALEEREDRAKEITADLGACAKRLAEARDREPALAQMEHLVAELREAV